MALFIFIGEHIDRVDVLVRHEQDVRWRGWVKVAKGCHLFVTKYVCAGDVTCDDLTKNTIFYAHIRLNQLNHNHLEFAEVDS